MKKNNRSKTKSAIILVIVFIFQGSNIFAPKWNISTDLWSVNASVAIPPSSVPPSTPVAPSSPHLSYCTEGRSYPFFLIHLCSAFTALNSHGDLSDHPGLHYTVDYWPANKPTNWESLYRFEWLHEGCFIGFIFTFLVTILLLSLTAAFSAQPINVLNHEYVTLLLTKKYK